MVTDVPYGRFATFSTVEDWCYKLWRSKNLQISGVKIKRKSMFFWLTYSRGHEHQVHRSTDLEWIFISAALFMLPSSFWVDA